MANRSKLIKANPLKFHVVMERLKEMEKKNKSLSYKGKSLSTLLAENSDYDVSSSSIPVQVKTAILKRYSSAPAEPEKLDPKKKMSDFNFSQLQYQMLTNKLNAIALSHHPNVKTIKISQVQNAVTVQDCIDLVTKAIS
jgi:4-diphosphocytidyl-2C-methyl-D-erythritol kinase